MSLKKQRSPISAEILELFDKLIENNSAIQRKGVAMPYTSINAHMFSFLDKDGSLGLRLPEMERAEFISKYNTQLCEAHGSLLKEYVLVPDDLFKKN